MADENNKETVVEVPAKFKAIVTAIEGMSVIDLNELVRFLEKKFGVSATPAVVTVPAAGAPVAAGAEEKSTVTVELKDGGTQKIPVIKLIKEVLGFGLKEAKDLVDGAPKILKENMKRAEAEELKRRLEEVGAKVEIK